MEILKFIEILTVDLKLLNFKCVVEKKFKIGDKIFFGFLGGDNVNGYIGYSLIALKLSEINNYIFEQSKGKIPFLIKK